MPVVLEKILNSIEGDAEVGRARLFDRASFVQSRRAGVAYRFREAEAGVSVPTVSTAVELARFALSTDLCKASLGVAAINSLIEPCGGRIEEASGRELLFSWAAKKDVCLVGHFAFTDDLRKVAKSLWVLELDPREGDLPASMAVKIIPMADVVAITGTTCINHTLEDLLRLAQGKRIMILGPSTIMSPLLFSHGVEALCGSLVMDPECVCQGLNKGLGLRYLKGFKRIIMTPE